MRMRAVLTMAWRLTPERERGVATVDAEATDMLSGSASDEEEESGESGGSVAILPSFLPGLSLRARERSLLVLVHVSTAGSEFFRAISHRMSLLL